MQIYFRHSIYTHVYVKWTYKVYYSLAWHGFMVRAFWFFFTFCVVFKHTCTVDFTTFWLTYTGVGLRYWGTEGNMHPFRFIFKLNHMVAKYWCCNFQSTKQNLSSSLAILSETNNFHNSLHYNNLQTKGYSNAWSNCLSYI